MSCVITRACVHVNMTRMQVINPSFVTTNYILEKNQYLSDNSLIYGLQAINKTRNE